VAERAGDPDGLAPWALQEHPPPAAYRRRVLYQRPELADAWHWARTSDDLAGLLAADRVLVRVRGEEITLLRESTRADGTRTADLRPGDVIVIDSASEIFTPSAEGTFSPPVVVLPVSGDDLDGIDPARRGCADDVLHSRAACGQVR
jgi:hypothetical protein